jgi:hypothetical protein
MRKICFAVLLVPALAWAEPKSADDWYKEGENQYNLGNFDRAVEAFKQAFTAEPNESKKAVYLFNVAQSYRQANDCKNAYFFYKRFLSLKENDTVKPLPATTRKQVEDRISELEACAQQAASISKKPPNNNLPPDGGGGGEGDKGQPAGDPRKEPRKEVATASPPPRTERDDDDTSVTTPATAPPHVISARLLGGATKVSAGDSAVPVQATFALIAGYPIQVAPRVTIEAGAAFTFTPVPFEPSRTMTGTKTGQLWGLVANGAATYEAIPKLGLRVDFGLGALFFANVDESPFTAGGMTTGALSMFHVRGAVSAEYAFTPNLVGTVTPVAFTYSPPKRGLAPDIKSITSIDFAMVGIGYRK